jgi:hypothetical protein
MHRIDWAIPAAAIVKKTMNIYRIIKILRTMKEMLAQVYLGEI